KEGFSARFDRLGGNIHPYRTTKSRRPLDGAIESNISPRVNKERQIAIGCSIGGTSAGRTVVQAARRPVDLANRRPADPPAGLAARDPPVRRPGNPPARRPVDLANRRPADPPARLTARAPPIRRLPA